MIILNLHHLYYFWVAARERNITKASRLLFLTQPTVSAQIIQLEKFLGKRLFDRDKKRLSLTPDGQVVLDYANEIFGSTQELLSVLKGTAPSGPVRLRLGVHTNVSKQVTLLLLKAVYAREPQALVQVTESGSRELWEQLRERGLDAVLADHGGPVPEGDHFVRTEIGKLEIFFVAAPRLAARVKSFPKDLSKIPIIMPSPQSPVYAGVEDFLSSFGVIPLVWVEVQDVELMRLLAIDGLGVAPLHGVSVSKDLKEGRLLRLGRGSTGISKTLWLITRRSSSPNSLVQIVKEHFRIRPA